MRALRHVAALARAHAAGLTIAAVAVAGGGTIAAAAGATGASDPQSTNAAQGVGEAAVDSCRASLPSDQHGLGACVSAYVRAHHGNHGKAGNSSEGKSDSSQGQGAEGQSDQAHGSATGQATTPPGTEGKSDSSQGQGSEGKSDTSHGQAAAHRPTR